MKRQPVTIENWSIVGRKLSVYEAPELQTYQIKGEVYNHPGFDAGESITTSTIRHRDGKTVLTNNTRYTLGTPHPDYASWCITNGKNIWKTEQNLTDS